MNLKECYNILEGDYESVLRRMALERLVQKFALKFLNDNSFDILQKSMQSKDYDEAFRAAHTIKGICQNLSFTKLLESSSNLTDALRNKDYEQASKFYSQTELDYKQVISALETYKSENGL